ncbi:GP179 protein, partial [Aleadryas rufinucha]|nr:GP179 protein [Aleadryas rufinucha]
CPWEVAEPQLEKGTAPGKERIPRREASKAVEKGSKDRESVCPWESQDSKSSDKSEICPWEVAAPPSGKEKPKLDKESQSRVSKSPSTTQGLLKELGDGTSGMKDRESVCPWESPDTEQPPAKPHPGSSALPK